MSLGGSDICLGDGAGERSDAGDVALAFGDGDGAARVEQVEGVARLDAEFVGGPRQSFIEQIFAYPFVGVKEAEHLFDRRLLEVEGREFHLVLLVDVAVSYCVVPHDVIDVIYILQVHADTLEAVGQFERHRFQINTADLLEVGKLANLHSVEPHLPAKSPCAERWALPVVLDEADIVVLWLDADGAQTVEVETLCIFGAWFDEHLQLVKALHPVRALAVAAVGGTARGLDIDSVDAPRIERVEEGGGVKGAGAHLEVVGLHDGAAAVGKEFLQAKDEFLKREFLHRDTPR